VKVALMLEGGTRMKSTMTLGFQGNGRVLFPPAAVALIFHLFFHDSISSELPHSYFLPNARNISVTVILPATLGTQDAIFACRNQR